MTDIVDCSSWAPLGVLIDAEGSCYVAIYSQEEDVVRIILIHRTARWDYYLRDD